MKRFSCNIQCPRCTKQCKTSRAVQHHMLKSHNLRHSPLHFLNEDNVVVNIDKPFQLPNDSPTLENYKDWLATLTERVNEALHPALPGN